LPNTHGSLLFKDSMSTRDAIQVARLKQAGAIVIGKTNTPEFGYTAFTSNRVYGTTRNPWKLDRTPGGSSGGSSAALAAGLVPLATASDGGGSVRIPASFTGLFGLKPSNGRIPWGPEETLRLSATIVSGPLTRCVRDAALWLDVTAGPHEADPYSLPHPGFSYLDAVDRDPGRLRVAYNPTFGYANVAREVRREVEAALKALESCGHVVELVEDVLQDVIIHWVSLMCAEDFGLNAEHIAGREHLLDPGYVPGIELGKQLTAESLAEIQRGRTALIRCFDDLFERFDLLASPTVASPPFNAAGPLPFEVDGRPVTSPGGAIAFTYPFNFSAHPAVSLRAGFTDDGLPVGLQLVSRRLREDLLLQVSRQYEQARPWSTRWPAL
jgi:aspartyl-tRNA(Asn)/glutamyl-tRNA(Gln) amidotransferase subunit A